MEEVRQFVVFRLGQEEYGVDILQVNTIERMMPITRVPKAPHYVEGVINLRGEIVPVIDLRKRFDLPPLEITGDTRIIIVMVDDLTVGMIVDSATEVIQLPQEAIEPSTSVAGNINSEFLEGVGKLNDRLLIILNLEKILRPGEPQQRAIM
ncbi:chemotaxis protein CheW [Thermosediminibacter oceani]|uniref:Chemotaxis protein CheW n=1 Tax=Thermosediminibacter oceani (strain ATCC BAA-1034 / DSM 16646 / JW/IW-1228P) TaxID=555079 RepID=D9S3A6_THEOJ|nr:chemotaxis protein CheW [Thermosediminibacter oceani]ADL07883.1 CheW protein [Thermosediminibacter oceani DSM 16646]